MWEALAALIVPLAKIIFEAIAKRKLDDKEFIQYVSAHQKKRSLAGETAISWEEALKRAQTEMQNERKDS